jgi:hypothetical protein
MFTLSFIWFTWEDAKIAIDTHYAKNGMNQEPTEYEGYDDDDDYYDEEEF